MSDSDQSIDSKEKQTVKGVGKDALRTGLLLLGSAVFGGIAVAIWNRRTLVKMQEEAEQPDNFAKIPDDDAIY